MFLLKKEAIRGKISQRLGEKSEKRKRAPANLGRAWAVIKAARRKRKRHRQIKAGKISRSNRYGLIVRSMALGGGGKDR